MHSYPFPCRVQLAKTVNNEVLLSTGNPSFKSREHHSQNTTNVVDLQSHRLYNDHCSKLVATLPQNSSEFKLEMVVSSETIKFYNMQLCILNTLCFY